MIKFFQKNRLKALSGEKLSNYLLYAVGEIVLIVIGILIALQISNWNEIRKEQRSESQLIDVLIADLKLKKSECVEDLAYGNSIIQGSESIINTWNSKKNIDTTNLK